MILVVWAVLKWVSFRLIIVFIMVLIDGLEVIIWYCWYCLIVSVFVILFIVAVLSRVFNCW